MALKNIFKRTTGLINTGREKFLSIPPSSFRGEQENSNWKIFGYQTLFYATSHATTIAPVFLPDGATITKGTVYGDKTAKTWLLYRTTFTDSGSGADAVLSANVGSMDIDANDAYCLVDNSRYAYYIVVNIDTTVTNEVYGASIGYTYKDE